MPQTDIITFTNVAVDSDTDIRLVKKGNVVYMLNCIKEGDGDNGVITNIKGTSAGLVTLPAGTNKVVAACDDPERSRVIFFLWNINSGNKLAIFYITKSSTSSGFILNPFSSYDPRNISNPRVVDRYLLFTNGTDEPACIDMIKFYNTTNSVSTTDKYSSITADLFTLIKRPPIITNQPYYFTSTENDYNKLTGGIYQFAFRFIYDDNTKSVLSPYTTAMKDPVATDSDYGTTDFTTYNLVPSSENITGTFLPSSRLNAINIRLDDWGDERVKGMEIYVRNSSSSVMALYETLDESKKPSSFSFQGESSASYTYFDCSSLSDAERLSVYQVINDGDLDYTIIKIDGVRVYTDRTFPDSATYSFTTLQVLDYKFYNDKPYKGVSEEDITRLYDFVPIKANHQEVVEDSRIIYAGITEGYGNVSSDVKFVLARSGLGNHFGRLDCAVTSDSTYYYVEITEAIPDITYWILGKTTGEFKSANYAVSATDTIETIADNLAKGLVARGGDASVVTSPVRVRVNRTGITSLTGHFFIKNIRRKFSTIKSNSKLSLGIIYRDKYGRVGNTNADFYPIDNSVVEALPTSPYEGLGIDYVSKIEAQVRHLPPEWAYKYQFVCKPDNTEYWQYAVRNTDANVFKSGGYKYIKVNKLLNSARDINGTVLPNYIFQRGDKVRLLGVGGFYPGTSEWLYYRPKSRLFNIIDFRYDSTDASYEKDKATSPSFILDDNGNKILDDASGYIVVEPEAISYTGEFIFLEIVREFQGSDNRYYEIADVYDIGNPTTSNRYHAGTTQNQSPSDPINTPAISTLNWGNCWLYTRNMIDTMFIAESMSVSDFYVSDLKPYGRPNVIDPNARQKSLGTMLRWSGKFVDNSFINRINRFDFDDYKLLNEKHGAITGVALSGYVLKALTQKKETSIYVNRNILTNADGSENVTASSTVLNVADPYIEDRGTLFPHSICVVNRDLYYVDTLRGQFVRSSPNGQIPVSDLGKRKAFKALCDAVNSTIYLSDVVTYYDDENRLIYVTFLINGTNTTLGFHEPSNSWMDYYSFTPEQGIGVGEECYVATSGQVYRLNDGSVNRCTFFGNKYDQVVEFVQNENSVVVKQYKDISLVSNKKWTVYPIEVLANDNNPRGMISRLNASYFKSKEGVYCAEYLRNMKTSSNTESAIDLLNGDRLRGNECKHRLTNPENDRVELFRVKIDYEISNTY